MLRPFCRRCLLAEVPDGAALARTVRAWIEALPEDARAPEDEVGARLDACRSCGQLADGTCMACGCYVEFRAAQKRQRCPYGRW